MTTIPKARLTALEERVQRLAADKSTLLLMLGLLNRLSTVTGLDALVETMLRAVCDSLGGANLKLYYRRGDEIHYADAFGLRQKLGALEDELVREVWESREAQEREQPLDDHSRQTKALSPAYTWAVPLMAGTELVGVLKLESLAVRMRDFSEQLPTFFNFAALRLKQEISALAQPSKVGGGRESRIEVRNTGAAERSSSQVELEANVLHLFAAHDVTDRQQIQEKLAHLAAIVASTADAVIGKTLEGTILSWNQAAEHIYGYSAAEMIGQPLTVLVPESRRSELTDILARLRAGQRIEQLETVRVRKDGQLIDVALTVSLIRDAEGRVLGAATIARDITARKRTEAALAHTAARLNEAQRIAHLGNWELDLATNALTWSEEIFRIFEIDPTRFTASYEAFLNTIHPEDREMVNAAYTNSVRTRTPYAIDHRLQFPDGRIKFVHEQCETIYEGDRPVRSVGTVQDITARKQVEEELRRSEERWHFALETIHAGVWDLDLTTLAATRSARHDAIFGYPALLPEWSYEKFFEHVVPEDRARVDEIFQAAVQKQQPRIFECQICRADGTRRWIRISGRHFTNRLGHPSLMGLVEDVTERKQAEQDIRTLNAELEQRVAARTRELAVSEERFRTLYNSAPVSIWLEDWTEVIGMVAGLRAQGVTNFETYFREHREFVARALNAVKILDVNEWTSAMFHARDKAEMLGSLETVFATPDTLPAFVSELTALAQGQAVFRTEMALNTVNGDQIQGLLTMTFPPPESAAGNVLVSVVDISERKRVEEALRESEQRFRAVAANTPDHVLVQDRRLRYTLVVNPQLGLTEAEMLGKTDQELVSSGDAERLLALKEEVLKSGEPLRVEVPLTARDGEQRHFEGCYIPKFGPRGEVDGLIGYFRDITERKQVEEKIRGLNVELQQRAALLEAANQELESFCHSVSHDLRAPLRSIDGFSRILLQESAAQLDDRGKANLQRILNSTVRMGQLIDDLLNLSRITREELRCIPVDLSALAATVVESLRHDQPERPMEVIIAPGLQVRGDPRLLRIVLENLLGNAWKFTSRQPAARVEFGRTETERGPAYFVRDNGAGFDMTYVGKLFGAFQRLHGNREFPGTGIGLATVQRIIHRHRGRVWAEGDLGRGATFYFTLPTGREGKLK